MAEDKSSNLMLKRIPVPWLFTIAYLIGILIETFVPLPAIPPELVLACITLGIILLAVGVVLAAWAQWPFRKVHTTVPSASPLQFVTSGPYRFSRNPVYLGLFLIFTGLSVILILVSSVILLLFAVFYVNGAVIPGEEKRLREDFGEAYERYCARVRRWV